MNLNNETIDYIKTNRNWQSIWLDKLIKYTPAGFAVFCMCRFISLVINKNFSISLILFEPIVLICIFCLVYYTLRAAQREKQFIAIPEVNNPLLNQQLETLNWVIISNSNKYIIANTKPSLFSFGETITLIFDDDKLLFNSTSNFAPPFGNDKNKLNYEKFCKLIH